ncbi:hypothetical protein ACFWA4_37225 [Streptomyces sp. NPDC060011]|uniref:hypothetical protein n=1 Tax=unclassified Streptomyces TaxID=2593676 RepID=UPI0013BA2F7F|nr:MULTISPECIES: hypothetical protein [unclassified Streptomyces]MCX4914791.1 hypothetical protein [Streptomyces sp. NBC_00687]NEB29311.1 hypothetical protein [Streptomyces sp. SID14446]WSD79648.1 hypothetical protein OHB33_26880 [Streptomyces sp. NBC_01558]WSK63231.1 hypothetical protein OG458_26965 [Streptomyces sp. NBC_01281]
MRALPVRRIATSALCATLLIGIAAPASMAADSDLPRGHSHAAAPVPGADALLAQTKTLGDISGVLAPVTALVDAALKADNGQIPADQATKLGQAAKDAIAKVTAAAPVAPPAAVPAVPPVALPAVPPLSKNAERPRALAAADVKADALTALQTAVDSLVKAVTSGDAASVVPAATAVVTGLVNFVVATVLGGGLPAPNLPGLPALPALPTSALPTGSLPVS